MKYAGIGSRDIPEIEAGRIKKLSRMLATRGWHLRTGGAKGSDTAFARYAGERKEIFLPWYGYNNLWDDDCYVLTEEEKKACMEVASKEHPAWHLCNGSVRTLHARNSAIILGPSLNDSVAAVICWTKNGIARGGTALGIRIAEAHDIPVFNLGNRPSSEIIEKMDELKRFWEEKDV